MKWITFLILLTVWSIDPGKIGKINTAKDEAKKAYLAGHFKVAVEKYKYLIDSLGVNEDEVKANLASAAFQANDTTNALGYYQQLTSSGNKKISSIAHQQLGVMANAKGKLEQALNDFKQAMKADPTNEDARYNYEVVKKKLEEQKKKDQQQKDKDKKQDKKEDQKKDQNKDNKDQNKDNKDNKDKKDQDKKDQDKKDQEKKDQQNKDDKNKEDKDQKDKKDQQNKDEKDKDKKEKKDKEEQQKEDEKKEKEKQEKNNPSLSDKLKDMQMSEDKAKMILEAMKNQEIQYLQQNKRKATKPKDKGKPDW